MRKGRTPTLRAPSLYRRTICDPLTRKRDKVSKTPRQGQKVAGAEAPKGKQLPCRPPTPVYETLCRYALLEAKTIRAPDRALTHRPPQFIIKLYCTVCKSMRVMRGDVMYAIIRHYRTGAGSIDAMAHRVDREFADRIPRRRSAPSFTRRSTPATARR